MPRERNSTHQIILRRRVPAEVLQSPLGFRQSVLPGRHDLAKLDGRVSRSAEQFLPVVHRDTARLNQDIPQRREFSFCRRD